MHSLIEYNHNYSTLSESLWLFSRDAQSDTASLLILLLIISVLCLNLNKKMRGQIRSDDTKDVEIMLLLNI